MEIQDLRDSESVQLVSKVGEALIADVSACCAEDGKAQGLKYKSVHRSAVINKVEPRLSLTMFYGPNKDRVIGRIEDLIDEEHPPLYRSCKYAEFFEEFYKQEGKEGW
ncbi:hypothetical protein ACE6H2_002574 [Prunus campanulata]